MANRNICHIGLAVRDLEQAISLYERMFQVMSTPPVEREDMRVSMVQFGNIQVELLEPMTNDGVIAKFLKARGEGIHHICIEVDDIYEEIESLKAKGMELVGGKPRPGIEGKIAFLHPRSTCGVLIELCEPEQE